MITFSENSALAGLGVREDSLSESERRALDQDGILLLPRFIANDRLVAMRTAYDAIVAKEGENAGHDHHKESGTRRIGDLTNKGEIWDWGWLEPKFLACARHVIGEDFRLCGYSAREPLKGFGHQPYHRDMNRQRSDEPYRSLAILLMLDDFTLANGAIRLVPGSHRTIGEPTHDPDPGEIRGVGQAGDVLVFNAHCLHGGATNHDGSPRRMIHVQYITRELAFWLEHQSETLRLKTYRRLSAHARTILDVT